MRYVWAVNMLTLAYKPGQKCFNVCRINYFFLKNIYLNPFLLKLPKWVKKTNEIFSNNLPGSLFWDFNVFWYFSVPSSIQNRKSSYLHATQIFIIQAFFNLKSCTAVGYSRILRKKTSCNCIKLFNYHNRMI